MWCCTTSWHTQMRQMLRPSWQFPSCPLVLFRRSATREAKRWLSSLRSPSSPLMLPSSVDLSTGPHHRYFAFSSSRGVGGERQNAAAGQWCPVSSWAEGCCIVCCWCESCWIVRCLAEATHQGSLLAAMAHPHLHLFLASQGCVCRCLLGKQLKFI